MNYKVETASASFIMALGIATVGAFQDLPFLKDVIGSVSAALLILCFIGLCIGYLRDGIRGEFLVKHAAHPVQSFAIGTWVAAISVIILTIHLIDPLLHIVCVVLYSCNVVLLVLYLILVIRNYVYLLIRNPLQNVLGNLNGIVLLACVSIQSMLIAGKTIFKSFLPVWCMEVVLVTGVLFYCIGLVLIVWRYLAIDRKASIINWANTNCIIHGAMSITGLASVTCQLFHPNVVAWIWLWVLFCFIIVEFIEVLRVIMRVRAYGWKQGLLVYAVSQWSRNFTFGMFWAFTVHFRFNGTFLRFGVGSWLRSLVIHDGVYVILILFLIEVGLFMETQVARRKQQITLNSPPSYPIT